ncbi:MAG: YfhO family protein [Acidobacteriia bacterium]|nr:YfhO family protein [Terriglobia bacterium]
MAGEHRDRYAVGAARLLLIVQPLVFFRKVLFHPKSHIPFDIASFHLPLATYIARCVREGILPFWDPYPYCGVPIHGDIQAQLFYPFTWISILLGNLSAGHTLYYWIEWLVPFHTILAGLFTFLLLRQIGVTAFPALFGGTVYQLGGFFASQTQHLGAICCGAWLPLTLLCILKLRDRITARWIAVLAVSTALSILAGFPAAACVVFGAAALVAVGFSVFLARRRRFYLAILAGFVLGHVIAAVQIAPTYQLARWGAASMRAEWYVTGAGLRVQSLASLVAPNYYHIFTPFDPAQFKLPINFTFLYVYCGLIPLALLVLAPFLRRAPHAKVLFALTVMSAIWMLGDETPVYRFVYTHLPGMLRGALYAEFALMAFCMFVALTSAVALQRVSARVPWPLLLGISLLTAADLIYFGAERPMNSLAGTYADENSEYNIRGYPGSLARIRELVGGTNPPLRMDYIDRQTMDFVLGSEMLKLPIADGDNPFISKRLLLVRRLFCKGKPWERHLSVAQFTSPLLQMLDVGFLSGRSSAASADVARAGLAPEADIAGLHFYRCPNPLPRFFLVHRLHAVDGLNEAMAYLARPDFKPAEEAVVEGQGLDSRELSGSGAVNIQLYSPNRVVIGAEVSDRAFLASSEAMYPGWTATINGKAAPIHMTNGAFRGVFLNPGLNQIVMTYWPERFLVWTAISVVSLMLAIAGMVFGGFAYNIQSAGAIENSPGA